MDNYMSIIKYEIAPLLKEYWFDDLEKAKEEIEKLYL
jgi:5-methylcytosine-specific restriction protein B